MSSEEPAPDPLDRNQMLKELQSWWEIPSIAQYISLFRESFNLPEIEIEELEKGLLDDSTEGPSSWLQDLILALLRSYMPGRVNAGNWEVQLQKLVNRKWPSDQEKPFAEDKSFVQLSLRSKVEIIYALCLYRLDRNDIAEVMKSMDADALRVQKLGIDDVGNTYWYFYGTRLYKEENCKDEKSWDEEWKIQKKKTFKKRGRGRPRKIQKYIKSDGESDDFEDMGANGNGYMNVKSKSRWSVVCDTIEEWVSFAEKFKDSKSKNEKALFQIVQENFLPTLNKIYEEKEKKLQQKIQELMPVREKIVTRRETRKLRGDTVESSPVVNGYSDASDEPYKLHMIKDRARRLEERQKRASESVFNGIQRRKKQRFSSVFQSFDSQQTELDDQDEENDYALTPKLDGQKMDLQSQMERLMSAVKLHKDAWPFLYPVSEDDAPGYYEIIKYPIDLSTIDTRLHNGEYETIGDLDADFSRMVTNCELYNGENHAYSSMVQTLWKMFRNGISKILDSLPEIDNSNDGGSEENSNSSNSSNLILKSPQIRSHKNRKDGKKKKKHGMEALEMLAQASELAIQNTNDNDMVKESHLYEEQNKQHSDFSGLKVSTINSHPSSLIEKFTSESSNESSGDTSQDVSYGNYSTYLNEAISVDKQSPRTSPNQVTPMNELASSNLAHLTSFIEKNNVKSLNILSNNDVTNVLSENSNSSGGSFPRESGNPDSLDHGLDNILDNDNVSNIISQIIKQPMYNNDNQLVSQTKDVSAYIDCLPNNDTPLNKRKSPPSTVSNFVNPEGYSVMQVNTQSNLGSSSNNMTTVDASVIGITPYAPLNKNSNSTIPIGSNHVVFANNESHQNAVPNLGHENRGLTNTSPYQPQMSPSELSHKQYYSSSDLMNSPSSVNVPNTSFQSFEMPISVTSSQATFAPTNTSNTSNNMPLQVPATFPASVQQIKPSHLVRVAVPPQPRGHIMFVSEANTQSGVTYHVYTQSKPDQNANENFVNLSQSSIPSTIRVSPNMENGASKYQEHTVIRNSPGQKKSHVSQQFRGSPPKVPSKTLPCYSPASTTSSSILKTSLPVTSSNFVPVNTLGKNKPTIIRTKAPETGQPKNATSFITGSDVNQPYNSPQNNSNMYQKVASETVPVVLSDYNQPSVSNQNNIRFRNSQSGTVTMQLPNGMPIVQQVLFPAGQQPIQLQNGGHVVFTNPQNPVNRVFSGSQIPQGQNSIRQLNQGFVKVMPQLVAQGPVMQVARDNGQGGLQFQTMTQSGPHTFTQVTQNPQFVNIPTYMIANQNQMHATSAHPVMNLQQLQQLTQTQQMPMNGQGNG